MLLEDFRIAGVAERLDGAVPALISILKMDGATYTDAGAVTHGFLYSGRST